MSTELLKTIFLPLALVIMMFGMGMGLSLSDFKRVILSPLPTLIGATCQLILLPAFALLLIMVFQLPPDLATGMIIIAACPGGATSNIFTHLSKGDTALSVTLTAVSSVITVFTIPLLVGYAATHYLGTEATVVVPFAKTVAQLFVITLIPIALGMWLNATHPDVCRRLSSKVNVLSLILLFVVILAAVLKEKDLAEQFRMAGPAALILNLGTMALGFGAAKLFRLPLNQRITIAIEGGIQNGTLALALALSLFDSARFAMPAVVYSLLMFVSGAVMIGCFGRRQEASAAVPSLS